MGDNAGFPLGNEVHIICECPTTKIVLEAFTDKFKGLTRLLNLPSFSSLTNEGKTRLVLGNPLLRVLQKELKAWIQEATSICGEFAHALRMHIIGLQLTPIDMSSDDESAQSSSSDDNPSLRFELASIPPFSDVLEPLNPTGQQMIGQHI